jgi:hypothetical protein
MKIIDTDSPIADAVAYAKSSQHHGKGVVISFARGMVIVRHDNGHAHAFRKPDAMVVMNRLLADLEVEGFDALARKGGGK